MKLNHLIPVIALTFAMSGCSKQSNAPKTIRLYAGAGLRKAVEQLMAGFEEQSDIRVEPDYAGSGMLLTRAKGDPEADLFMPGDVWYVDRLHELTGNILEKKQVSYFVPCIIVQKGNPKQITSIADFLRPDVRTAIGKPDACQIGRLTVKLFEKAGLKHDSLNAKQSLTVNELGVWVEMNDVDAAIVWDAIAANLGDDVEIVEIPKQENIISSVVVGLLGSSQKQDAARTFVEFMAGPEGKAILKANGYRVETP